MQQKFLDGKYASIFMYSGAMDVFERAGVYSEDKIQAVPLPQFEKSVTNIAAWQYVLNKASKHKEGAIKFLKYAASREESISYAECMNRLPPGWTLFQKYIMDEISQDEFCRQAQAIVDGL